MHLGLITGQTYTTIFDFMIVNFSNVRVPLEMITDKHMVVNFSGISVPRETDTQIFDVMAVNRELQFLLS